MNLHSRLACQIAIEHLRPNVNTHLSHSSRIDATDPLIRYRRASNKRRMNELQRVAASNWGLQASALFYNKL